MFGSKNLRAAALGFGLPFLLAGPVADGAISTQDAGHALGAYRLILSPAVSPDAIVVANEAAVGITISSELAISVPPEADGDEALSVTAESIRGIQVTDERSIPT